MDVVAAVGYPGEHVDTVGQDEADTAQVPSEDERGGEKDKREDHHSSIVPVQEWSQHHKRTLWVQQRTRQSHNITGMYRN